VDIGVAIIVGAAIMGTITFAGLVVGGFLAGRKE